MNGIFTPLTRAFEQLDDPVFLGVLVRSLLFSALSFLAALALVWWVLHDVLTLPHWLASVLSTFGTALAAFWLFMPVSLVIASFYSDRISAAVERRYYVSLPPPRGASAIAQSWDGVALGLKVLGYMTLALIVSILLPGVGVLIGWAIGAWSMGRALFSAAALRRVRRRDARTIFLHHRLQATLLGAVFVLMGMVPLLNLFVPVLGTAAMVHVLHRNEPG